MFYTVYKITNLINNKIYIGSHRTNNIDDGYLGSGKIIKQAIKKYGASSFSKEILFIFDNKQKMFDKERDLVNEEFVNDPTTYNLLIGGKGGFSTESAKRGRLKTNQVLEEKYGKDWRSIVSKLATVKTRVRLTEGRKTNPNYCKLSLEAVAKGRLAAQSDEAKRKRRDTMRKNGHNRGEKSSQFGTCWIYNPNTKENKKIKKDALIPDGWIKGRKMK